MGCAILPHLRALVEIIEHGLVDEQQKVRTITALALAALAEAATPYGIESFDSVLKPLWKGIRTHRGKGLAAFLKVRIKFNFFTYNGNGYVGRLFYLLEISPFIISHVIIALTKLLVK